MDHDRELRRRAGALLRDHGPMTAPTLLGALERDEPDGVGALTPRDLWELLLGDADPDAFAAYPLLDGRLCDLEHLTEGLTLTHLVTEEERAAGAVAVEPDLTALHLTAADGRSVPLAGADAPLTFTDDDRLTGPDGWLPDAAVLVARLADGRVEVAGIEAVPPVDATTARRLADTRDALAAASPEAPIDEVELLIEARVRYPRLLSSPGAPLSELLAAEGLASDGHDVRDAHAARDDAEPGGELTEHLRLDHGLDEDTIDAVLGLHGDTLRLANEVLRASVERMRAAMDAGEDIDPSRLTDADRQQMVEALAELDLAATTAHLDRALATLDGAAAVVEDVLEDDPVVAATLLALLTHAAPDTRDRARRANVAWVRARALELTADDHALAERELRRAVEADGDHGPATYDLAHYLSVRGQAGAALGLARRVDGPGVEELIETLTPFTRPGPMSAGRNDPCPCGSGRKHKVCCARRDGWPLADRMPWLMHKLLTFYGSTYARDVTTDLGRACGIDQGPGELDVAALNLALFEGGLIADCCDVQGSLLPADELERLREWSTVRASVYELLDAGGDGACRLLDLRSGERVTVVDRSLARTLGEGRAVLAWLVPGDDGPVPFYGAVGVPDHARTGLLDLLDEQPSATRLGAWLRAMHAPPRLATTTGEELVAVEQVFAVDDPAAARTALTARLGEPEPGDDGAGATWHLTEEHEGQELLAGSITLDGERLQGHTLSVPRARRLAGLIADAVPDARLLDEQRLPASELTDRVAGALGDEDEDDGLVDLDALSDAERADVEAQLEELMVRHEDAWVDSPLPALGGVTPRQAVADPTRRDDVRRLLDEFAEHATTWEGPGRPMDAGRLRRLLDL